MLADQLGASGEFAQPYVLAHEYGHHVQTLLGTEPQVRRQQERDPDNANQLSVQLELQADCYAGAWAKNATGTADAAGQKIFTSITEQDIQEGLDTAGAIGDDTIQKKSGGSGQPGRVHPRHVRAAPAVVPHRLRQRRPEDLRHLRQGRVGASFRRTSVGGADVRESQIWSSRSNPLCPHLA